MPATPRFVGALALAGRVERAIEFSQRTDVYVAYGRTTPWLDENVPPAADPLALDVEEIIGFKKATISLVVPDVTGTIRIYDTMWKVVDEATARSLGSPYVYIRASFEYDELPLVDYRQLGIYSGLVRDPVDETANPGRIALLPMHVQDPGVLEYIYNDKSASRSLVEIDDFDIILTF